MSCRNDTPDLDVDVPIRYSITPAGRLSMELALAEEHIGFCQHTWQREANAMVCSRCGLDRPVQVENSIPAYLRGKGRYGN
jgi:hypothetical protein